MNKIAFFVGIVVLLVASSCDKDECEVCIAPSLANQNFEVLENSIGGTIIDTVRSETGIRDEFEFTILDGNEDGNFVLDTLTGELTVSNGANLDYELVSEFYLTVKLTNSFSDISSSATITISVIDTDEIPQMGLVGHYKFDGSIDDLSENNYHGTNFGSIFSTDRFNNQTEAIQFDGINDYVTLPSTFDFEIKSISLWFNAEEIPEFDFDLSPTTSWGSIITCDNAELQNGAIRIGISKIDGIDKVWIYKGGMDSKINPNLLVTEITKSKWYNITLTISSDKIQMYLNGKLINSFITTVNHSVDGYLNLMLGTSRLANNRFFKGKIDDLLIYNRVLSAEEIEMIYME